MRKNTFIQGAMVLAVAGIIVKFIGAFSRIYLSRLLGGEGIGLYQMAYPIYLLCLSVSSAGLPVAISIMVAERNAIHDYLGGQKVFRISMISLAATGLFFSVLLFFGAQWLVDSGMVRDERAYWSLLALSPAIFCATMLATLRGYFQGLQLMTPTAVSQIIEQVVRVAAMIIFAIILLPYGLEFGAAGATLGAAPGAFMGIMVLIAFFYTTRNWRNELAHEQDLSIKPQGSFEIIKRLLVLAIPVSLANIMLPIVSNIDLFIVPQRLEVAGYNVEQATTLFGYLTGMATSLVNMPTIVTASLAASLVPVISEAIAQKKEEVIISRTDTAIRLSNLVTIPSFIGMCVIATPISTMLYAIPDAGPSIAVMSFGIFLLGIQQVTTGVLQGMGKTSIPFINMVISATVKVVLSWNLTAIPCFGVLGAAWATNADFGVAAVLNLIFLYKYRKYVMDWIHTIKIFISAFIMGAAVYGVYNGLHSIVKGNTIPTVFSITVGIVVYVASIILIKAVKEDDVVRIPKIGNKLAKIIRKLSIKS
ncbi:putative polysaccharide biosynthesis protein [Dialister micraerophilus]|uniref:putative polysaccharide biosynthesis protein n=1 Tax=Dialister micraerophilus TaxID=309120 RepID=UPI0023F439FD|nr:polysaccharide biosynthesis protein [Dialister micraerophilus]